MGKRTSPYNILVSFVAAIGSLTYGYSISAFGNVLANPGFNAYMNLAVVGPRAGYTTSMIALWNCILYVGAFFGCGSYTLAAAKYGRRAPIAVGAGFSLLGSALQAGAVNAAMLSVARLILGLGIGLLLTAVPTYQAEIAPPSGRGLIVGLHAAAIGYGTALAQWVGVAFFHTSGTAGWRGTLAIQNLFPLILSVCIWFLPESPRWLYVNGKSDEAERVLIKLHRESSDPDNVFAHNEMAVMQHQIDYEMQHSLSLKQAFRTPSMRRRFLVGWLAMTGTQAGGLIVVLTYQSVIYRSLGFSPFMIGVMGGIWCICNGTSNLIGGLIVDYLGRRRQMMIGYTVCTCNLIILCILTVLYAGKENKAGNTAAVVFTFTLILGYGVGVECAAFVYTSELFPSEWRAIGVSTSITAVPFWSILFTAVASPAFANIGGKYYIVFACMSALMIVLAYFLFPETKGFSLEQIAAVFGDEVVDTTPPSALEAKREDESTHFAEGKGDGIHREVKVVE